MLTALATTLALAFGVSDGLVVSKGLPMKAPIAVGMSAERLAAVDRVVTRGITAGGYPGASVVVGRKGAAVVAKGFGTLGWGASSPAVTADNTIYDLASLTKVIGTTTAIMLLFDEGKIDLDAPVVRYLPAFGAGGGMKEQVTIRHLLTHRSGLPAGRDLWRGGRSPDEARRMVLETPIYCRPNQCFEYSDLGADVLGFVAEEVSGKRLDVLLEERVFGPLGMDDTHFRPAESLVDRIAPTEVTPPRGYPLRGEVHDENAYALGGIAGHAGLFSTAADLSVFAQMMLNGGTYDGVRILSPEAVKLFSARAGGTRALGWDTCNGDGGCGKYMGSGAYGHTGYTATSIWIDPEHEMFVILLTNRVHAARAKRPAKVISDVRADLADAAALAVLDAPEGIRAMPAAFRADEALGWNRAEVTKKKVTAKKSSKKSSAKKPTAKKSSSKSSTAKKSTAKSSSSKASTAKKSSSKSASSKKPAAKSSSSKSSGSKASSAKKPAAKSTAKKSTASSSKSSASKSKSTAAKKPAPKKATTKKS